MVFDLPELLAPATVRVTPWPPGTSTPSCPGCCTPSASTGCTSAPRAPTCTTPTATATPTSWPGFGVFGVGHNHPVVRKALHDMLDAELADLVQFDTPLLPGLLGERLLAKAPGLDRVYFCNSGTEAVEAALKFARYATGRRRIIYCDHAYHGLTVGSLSANGSDEFRRGFAPAAAGHQDPVRRPGRARSRTAPRGRGRLHHRAGPGQGRRGGPRPASWPRPGSCCTTTGRCSSATRCSPGSAAPGGSSPTSTTTSSRTSSPSPRRCPVASCRSAPRWPRDGSSTRSTRRSTGCWCTTPRSAPTPPR